MKKSVLIPIVVIVTLIGLAGYKIYDYKQSQKPDTEKENKSIFSADAGTTNTTVVNSTENGSKDQPSTKLASSERSSINVKTDVPINGTKKGVIEVGASGFNAFVVDMDKDKHWELVAKHFGASFAYEGFANTKDVYEKMKEYITIITDQGVAGRNIHFVISSGALKNPKMELIANAIKERGFTVNKVTADQEGKYALKALLPDAYKANSFTVDIGSGNTKISWYEGDRLKSVETVGAKYYQDNKKDPDVFEEVKKAVSQVPTTARENCFMIGGVPFKLATKSRNDKERFTALENPDNYSAGDDVKVKSGINIYRAIYETSNAKNFIFDWDANFTIGFLMSLN